MVKTVTSGLYTTNSTKLWDSTKSDGQPFKPKSMSTLRRLNLRPRREDSIRSDLGMKANRAGDRTVGSTEFWRLVVTSYSFLNFLKLIYENDRVTHFGVKIIIVSKTVCSPTEHADIGIYFI